MKFCPSFDCMPNRFVPSSFTGITPDPMDSTTNPIGQPPVIVDPMDPTSVFPSPPPPTAPDSGDFPDHPDFTTIC